MLPSFRHPCCHACHRTALTYGSPTHAGCTCIFLAAPTQPRACVLLCVCTVRAAHRFLHGSPPAWWCTRPQAVSAALIPSPLSPRSPPHALTHVSPSHAGCALASSSPRPLSRVRVFFCLCTVRAAHCLLRGLSTGMVMHSAAGGECCPHSATLVAMLASARSNTWPAHRRWLHLIFLVAPTQLRACVLLCMLLFALPTASCTALRRRGGALGRRR